MTHEYCRKTGMSRQVLVSCSRRFVTFVLELLLHFMPQHAVVHSRGRHAAFECPWNSESVTTLCRLRTYWYFGLRKIHIIQKKKKKIPVIGPALDASSLKTLRGFLISSLSKNWSEVVWGGVRLLFRPAWPLSEQRVCAQLMLCSLCKLCYTCHTHIALLCLCTHV